MDIRDKMVNIMKKEVAHKMALSTPVDDIRKMTWKITPEDWSELSLTVVNTGDGKIDLTEETHILLGHKVESVDAEKTELS